MQGFAGEVGAQPILEEERSKVDKQEEELERLKKTEDIKSALDYKVNEKNCQYVNCL